ncbi:hypothetical protein RFI_09739 [Reticulomyxa filosa]|uniref:Uncharacterized protein n=1 Tax=Reticulomyxa filosa TaxID=46433 RepID=X6NN52_RETFI|nr:hypothetical protein RFI_09739 [Reticulomyxa filosa]|eukprot:ETO27391.1 hypothetical protein RFI_09739 [Reticulomyxa filosa]
MRVEDGAEAEEEEEEGARVLKEKEVQEEEEEEEGAGVLKEREVQEEQEKEEAVMEAEKTKNLNIQALMDEVDKLNPDFPGIGLMKCWMFDKAQSLTDQSCYYYNRETNVKSSTIPPEVDEKTGQSYYEEHRAKFEELPTHFGEKKMQQIPNVVTNSYIVTGEMITIPIAHYVITFKSEIDPRESALRRQMVLGTDKETQMRNDSILRDTFDNYVFDNHALYAFGKKSYPPRIDNLSSDKVHKLERDEINAKKKCIDTVIFLWYNSLYINSPEMTTDQQQALLNIFSRRIMQACGLTRIVQGWFLGKQGSDIPNMKPVNVENCLVLPGFEVSVSKKKEIPI